LSAILTSPYYLYASFRFSTRTTVFCSNAQP
jgi:hypothetical protein